MWEAITDPEWTRRYLAEAAIDTDLTEGSKIRYVAPGDDPIGEGVLEIVEPGRRLVMTWRVLHDVEARQEPPGRVEWSIEAANAEATVTRVRLRHYDLGLSPRTWAIVGPTWSLALDGLKTVLETGAELGPVEVAGSSEGDRSAADVERSWHRTLGAQANNAAWELLDGRELVDDEAFDLLGRVYAAAHHWRAATEPGSINRARAAWLCSRAHATLGDGGPALRLAERCEALTAEAGDEAADFDRVYAVEARARALACRGDLDEARALRRRAVDAAAAVADEQDRAIVETDLAAPPWYGL